MDTPYQQQSPQNDQERAGNGRPGEGTSPLGDAKEVISQAARNTKDAVGAKLEERAESLANTFDAAVDALRQASEQVRDGNATLGMIFEKSAEGLDAISQSVAGGNINRAVSDLGGFARRQPAIFLGASMALGFAIARIGKTAIAQNASDAQQTH